MHADIMLQFKKMQPGRLRYLRWQPWSVLYLRSWPYRWLHAMRCLKALEKSFIPLSTCERRRWLGLRQQQQQPVWLLDAAACHLGSSLPSSTPADRKACASTLLSGFAMKLAWHAQSPDAPCMAVKPGETFDCTALRACFDGSISGRRSCAVIVRLVPAGNVFFTKALLELDRHCCSRRKGWQNPAAGSPG